MSHMPWLPFSDPARHRDDGDHAFRAEQTHSGRTLSERDGIFPLSAWR